MPICAARRRVLLDTSDSAEAIERMCTEPRPAKDPINLTRDVALTLAETGRYHDAIPLLHNLVCQAPDDYASLRLLGELYTGLHDLETATIWFERALAVNPCDRDVLRAYVLHWSRLGDFERARAFYHSRMRWAKLQDWFEPSPRTWQGQDVRGKTVRLIVGDIYFGDALQFVRFAPIVKRYGAVVIVEGPRRVCSLLRTVPGIDDVVAFGDPLPPYDYEAAAFWLLFALGTPIQEMLGSVPYIEASTVLRSDWRRRIRPTSEIKVGLVWGGSSYQCCNPYACRSMPLEELRPLTGVPGTTFYSLQCCGARKELANARPPFPAIDLAPDFPNTAAAIEALDVVITVDTSIGHLAGALGKPTFLMLPYHACFRWMLDRDDTPWYPSMRLFRQTAPGQWSGPVRAVTKAVAQLITERRAK